MGMFDFLAGAAPDDPRSAQALEMRKKIALAMIGRDRKGYPKTLGEGLTAIGDALGERAQVNAAMSQLAAREDYVRKNPTPSPESLISGAAAAPAPAPPPRVSDASDAAAAPPTSQIADAQPDVVFNQDNVHVDRGRDGPPGLVDVRSGARVGVCRRPTAACLVRLSSIGRSKASRSHAAREAAGLASGGRRRRRRDIRPTGGGGRALLQCALRARERGSAGAVEGGLIAVAGRSLRAGRRAGPGSGRR